MSPIHARSSIFLNETYREWAHNVSTNGQLLCEMCVGGSGRHVSEGCLKAEVVVVVGDSDSTVSLITRFG